MLIVEYFDVFGHPTKLETVVEAGWRSEHCTQLVGGEERRLEPSRAREHGKPLTERQWRELVHVINKGY